MPRKPSLESRARAPRPATKHTRAAKAPAKRIVKTPAKRVAKAPVKRAVKTRASRTTRPANGRPPKSVLVVDVGGTNVKFLATGETQVRTVASGPEMTPKDMVREVMRRSRDWEYEVVALGIPGLVGRGGPVAEPGNLGPGWVGFDYSAAFGRPVRIVNDATLQALGSYHGGRMLFLGFGTGIGSVLISDHSVVPLELGELRFKAGSLFDQLGRAALEKVGPKRWRTRVLEVVPSLQRAFLADYVVIGGGNSKFVEEPLPPNVRIGHNLTAFRGGHRLWGIADVDHWTPESGSKPDAAVGNWRLL